MIMITTLDLEKWQKAIQGIEAGQKELSSEELSAFHALKELFNNSNFESSGSVTNIKVIKDNLKQHDKHRLLRVHLINFVSLCEQYFKNKNVQVNTDTQVSVQSKILHNVPHCEIKPPTPLSNPPSTFKDIPNEDIANFQKAIEDIEKEQNNLSPVEWSAFETLRDNYHNGNFVSNGSIDSINILKNSLPSHSKHRLLQKVHLPNFIKLCEKYFKPEAITNTILSETFSNSDKQNAIPTFQPPTFQPIFQPPVNPEITSSEPVVENPIINPEESNNDPVISATKRKGNNKQLILIIAVIALLIGGWQIYKNWDTVSNWEPISKLLGKTKTTVPNDSTNINPLVGKWKGILNNEAATLEFLCIDTVGNIKAQIFFPENKPDTLKLSGTKDEYLIDLKNETGKYSGLLQRDSSVYSGTFYDKNTGVSSNFSFRNPKIAIDSLTENTAVDTAYVAEQAKDSTRIAPIPQERGKTDIHPVTQTQKIIQKNNSFDNNANSITTNSNTVTPTVQPQLQTFTTSNFTKIGNAALRNYGGKTFYGDINITNGFRFTVSSTTARTATFCIVYRSDNRNGKLVINGVTQIISFSSTNWAWGTKTVQVSLQQGTNTIEFYGGYPTSNDWSPDIAEITVTTNSNTVTPTIQSQPQTFTTSNYTRIGKATLLNYGGKNYIGDINTTNGFQFTVNSSSTITATFGIVYRTDPNRGGKLIVNNYMQNIMFDRTGWSFWGTKTIQVSLRQGANTIQFYGGFPNSSDYAPDIAEITIK